MALLQRGSPGLRSGLAAFSGTRFLSLLCGFPTFFLFGYHGVRDDAAEKSGRQSLFLAFFLAMLDFDVNVIRVAPFLLKGAPLFPEAALVEPFTVSQVLCEIGVHIAAKFFDLDDDGLHGFPVREVKLPHISQQGNHALDTLIEQEQAFVDAQFRGTCGNLRGKVGPDTFVVSHRCTSCATLVRGAPVL
jgi:hypothetical protein